MRLKKIIIILAVFIAVFNCVACAQSNPAPDLTSVNPPSPNAASLEQFGTYPTTLYNGLVDISVPVYDIKTSRLEVPINISYHASGIKVTDVPSWVGSGWALNTGGEITRQVMGNPDDKSQGYLASGNIVKNANTLNPKYSNDDISYIQNVLNRDYDGEPDLFSYIYPGSNGNFLFNKDKTSLIKIPQDKNKIIPDLTNNRVTIIDENGNTYIFGKSLSGTQCVESSSTDGPVTVGPNNTAWMLTNIISADKSDTITFNYYSSVSESYQDIYNYWTVSDQHMDIAVMTPIYHSDPGQGTEVQGSINSINGEYKLSEIDFKNGKVVFGRASGARLDRQNDTALKTITIYNYDYATKSYQPIKTVNLFQSYFHNNDRLRLDSMQITGNGISRPEVYKFSYNATLLPPRISLLQDYWGYYNSNPGATLIPQMQVQFIADNGYSYYNMTVGDANRNADTSRVKACSLEKIYYPTGGYAQFVYESNVFDLNNVITYGGGLRIAEILNYDGVSATPQVTYYKYGTGECGYGYLNIPGTSVTSALTYSNEIELYNYENGELSNLESMRQRTYSSMPNYNFTPIDGSPIFYPSITEYRGNASGLYGKTIYNYEYYPDIINFILYPSNKTHTQSYLYRRDHLLSKTVYDKNNNVLYNESNTYSTFDEQLYDDISIVANQHVQYATSPWGAYTTSDPNIQNGMLYQYGSYTIQTGLELLTNNTKTTYNQADPSKSVTVSTNYTYDLTNYEPSSIATINSIGESEITRLTYPTDYTIGTTPTLAAAKGMQCMQNNNVIAPVVEKYWQKQNADGSNLRTVGGVLTYYHPTLPLPDSIFQLQLSAGSAGFSPTQITYSSLVKDANYSPLIKFDQYDAAANILQQHKLNDVSHSYVWDYRNEYPVASVLNAAFNEIAYTSFEADGKGNWVFSGTPVGDASAPTGKMAYSLSTGSVSFTITNTSKAYIVSYWSKAGSATVNGSSGTAGLVKNGWTYYEHTLPAGTNAVTVAGTVTIDEIRLYPADAQMTTYTYNSNIGISSECSSNNTVQYYEYDGLGRLQDIKDMDHNIIKTFQYSYEGL